MEASSMVSTATESNQTIDLVGLIRRRTLFGLTIAICLFAVAGTLVFLWPSTYRSSATILIEEPSVAPDMVKSTVSSLASEQLQILQTRIMTTQNLGNLIDEFNLYPAAQKNLTPRSELIDSLRDKVNMTMTNVDVTDPKSGRADRLTIAFTLSFDARSPDLAQKVTNKLVELYLAENNKNREEKAAVTTEFLSSETSKLRDQVRDLEAKLADVRARYAGNLPDQQATNDDMLNQAESQLMDTQRQIEAQRQRRGFLSAQLSSISPYAPPVDGQLSANPAAQLQALQVQYATLSSQYGPNHPDVVRLKRQIQGLQSSTGTSGDTSALRSQLQKVTDELNAGIQRYGAKHPDVIRLKKEQSSLRKQIASAGSGGGSSLMSPSPDNPTYIQMQSQLGDITSDLRGLQAQEAGLQQHIADLRALKAQAPQAEREYDSIKQQYDAAVARYQATKEKASDARVAQNLEDARQGATFSLLEPPNLPDIPVKPNRPLLLFFGGILSLAAGAGSSVLREMLDQRIVTTKYITQTFGTSPLVLMPVIKPELMDSKRKWRHRLRLSAAMIAFVAASLIIFHLFFSSSSLF
jgi:uncharacterized protein involved in exopolysaccharide biosynthesis